MVASGQVCPHDFNFSHFTWLRVFFPLPALDVCIGRHTTMTAQACKGDNVCMCLRFMRSDGWSGGLCLCVCGESLLMR